MSSEDELVLQIKQQLASLPDFGQLQIFVKKHVGSYSNTDFVKMSNRKYAASTPEEANADCATDIYSLIKGIQQAELTGSLGFSIQFKKGRADLMAVQDFKKL